MTRFPLRRRCSTSSISDSDLWGRLLRGCYGHGGFAGLRDDIRTLSGFEDLKTFLLPCYRRPPSSACRCMNGAGFHAASGVRKS